METFENISYGVGLSVASQLINTFNKDSFSPFKSTVHYGNIFYICSDVNAWFINKVVAFSIDGFKTFLDDFTFITIL